MSNIFPKIRFVMLSLKNTCEHKESEEFNLQHNKHFCFLFFLFVVVITGVLIVVSSVAATVVVVTAAVALVVGGLCHMFVSLPFNHGYQTKSHTKHPKLPS